MSKTSPILVGLEIGTSKICAAIGEENERGEFTLLGIGQAKSHGVRKGEIVDPAKAQEDVRAALGNAEEQAQVTVRNLFLGITGRHIEGFNNTGMHPVACLMYEAGSGHGAAPPALLAQDRSAPSAQPLVDSIPAARDIAYVGTLQLDVDASDITQRIWHVKQTIPVSGVETLTLLYPEWLPGKHAPRGQIEKVAGLRASANGQPVNWQRRSLDMFAIDVSVPSGAREIVLSPRSLQ